MSKTKWFYRNTFGDPRTPVQGPTGRTKKLTGFCANCGASLVRHDVAATPTMKAPSSLCAKCWGPYRIQRVGTKGAPDEFQEV